MLRASAESILYTSLYDHGADPADHGASETSQQPSRASSAPMAGILDIDGVQILLDCGMSMDEEHGSAYLSRLKPHLASIDCVLLSSPDVSCCGALPFVMKHLRRGVPVVAPTSLAKVGTHNVLGSFMAKYPSHATYTIRDDATAAATTYTMTVDDIFSAFRAVKEPYGNRTVIRKWQDSSLLRRVTTVGGGGNASAAVVVTTASDFITDLDGDDANHNNHDDAATHQDEASVIVAEPIGNYRVVGGFMWRLAYQSDDVLYCPDVSLAPSVMLRRTTMPSRSTLVLMGCAGFADDKVSVPALKSFRSAYDDCIPNLMRNITDTLRREKDVLLPVTVSGRGVEMMLLVCKLLQEKGIANYRVVLAHYQAKELMARIKTMTELLLDGLVYGDQDPFAAVVCCRTAEEVLSVASPKIVFADGIGLDEGLAAELLRPFMTTGPNLIAVVAQPAGEHRLSNAQRLLDEAQAARATASAPPVFAWSFKKRTKLNKVELEQYYLAQETRDAQQRAEEAAAAARAARRSLELAADGPGGNWDDDDNEEDGAAFPFPSNDSHHAAAAATTLAPTMPAASWPSGLYLPSGPSIAPARNGANARGAIVFPMVESNLSLAAHLAASLSRRPADGDAGVSAYGIPLTQSEVQAIRRSAPQRIINDDAPLDLIQAVNDAQLEANIPCKVSTEQASAPLIGQATVFSVPSILYEGTMDPAATRQLVVSTFAPTVKRLVPLRCSASDVRALTQFCRAEQHAFRALTAAGRGGGTSSSAEQVAQLVVPPKHGVAVQLAVAVFAYAVDLDPAFAQHIQRQLRPVRETRSTGYWEVGVVRGMMSQTIEEAPAETNDDTQQQRKRQRVEAASGAVEQTTHHGAPLLTFPDGAKHWRRVAAAADADGGAAPTRADNDADGPQRQQDLVPLGSVFIGGVELPTVRDYMRQQLHLRADVSRGLLVIDNGSACVRKSQSGDITLACAVGQAKHLSVREAIYAQYQHAL